MTAKQPDTRTAPTTDSQRSSSPFTMRERVRWSDVDAAGVVYFASYLRLFEAVETEMFRSAGLTLQLMSDHFRLWLVRRQVVCDYLQPILLDQEVDLSAYVAGLGNTSMEIGFLVREASSGTLAATAVFRIVAVSRDGFAATPVPRPIRDALRPFTVDHSVAHQASRAHETSDVNPEQAKLGGEDSHHE